MVFLYCNYAFTVYFILPPLSLSLSLSLSQKCVIHIAGFERVIIGRRHLAETCPALSYVEMAILLLTFFFFKKKFKNSKFENKNQYSTPFSHFCSPSFPPKFPSLSPSTPKSFHRRPPRTTRHRRPPRTTCHRRSPSSANVRSPSFQRPFLLGVTINSVWSYY
jgi:hypothetical protein